MTTQNKTQETATAEFQNFVELLGVYTEACNRIQEIELDANDDLLEIITDSIPNYAALQVQLTRSEAALEQIARDHPEWFEDKKSVSTPYGTVKMTRGKKLDIPNPEASILLLRSEAEKNPEFKIEDYVHIEEAPNKEALEKLPPSLLKKFRIHVIEDDNFSVVPAKVKMGKAVKELANKKAEI